MLNWKDCNNTRIYDESNGMDGLSEVNIHMFAISCWPGRVYNDGTYQYRIYLSIPSADSKEIVTLCKVRGHLADAKAKVEELFADIIKATVKEENH